MTGLHVRKSDGSPICDQYRSGTDRLYSLNRRCVDCHTLFELNPATFGDLRWDVEEPMTDAPWICVELDCLNVATIKPTHYLIRPTWCADHDPAVRHEQIDVTPMDQVEPEYVNGAPTRTTTNRILWNRRPTGPSDTGDIDEIVIRAEWVHVEQMDDRCWWIGIDLPNGGYWAGNFSCDSRGRMRFTEQERSGFEWDGDDTHETS